MRLVFLGLPGAGKGTQAKLLCEKEKIPQISTGDILRKAAKDGTDMGMKARKFMNRGDLVPDDVIIGVVKERLKEEDCKNGYILDGFPRTVVQAQALEDELVEGIDRVVFFDVDDDEVVVRLTGRRSCSGCGEGYHVSFNPPEKNGLCDKCGSKLIERPDDNEESIKNRLAVYRKDTSPLVKYYENNNLLVSLVGKGSIDNIFLGLCALLYK